MKQIILFSNHKGLGFEQRPNEADNFVFKITKVLGLKF